MVLLYLIPQNLLPLVSPASTEPDSDLDCMCGTVYLLTLGLLENVDIPDKLRRESARITLLSVWRLPEAGGVGPHLNGLSDPAPGLRYEAT